jgi:hypothetical protein
MGMLYEYSDEELTSMGYKKSNPKPTAQEIQSEVDRSRRNNIVRATETYAQTLTRIKAKYKH